MQPEISSLLNSDEPSIRYRTLVSFLDTPPDSAQALKARSEIPTSERVQKLLSERDESGRIPFHPYFKWRGAHWVLATLADLGYPPGDPSLRLLMEQVYNWLLSDQYTQSVKAVAGRTRLHASMDGNALFVLKSAGRY